MEEKWSDMKMSQSLKQLFCLLLIGATLTGCQTTAPQADVRPRFYDSASANVILKFNRWDTIHLVRPDTRESGFLPILTRADVEREIKSRRVDRKLAVVVLGFLFPPDVEAQYAREWDALLSALGFQRVVVLRTGAQPTTDGLLIVHDSGIAGAHDQPAVAAAKFPPLSPPAGANAANTPGR